MDHYDKYGDAVFKKPLPRHMLDSEWGFEGVPADIQGYEYANADMLLNKCVSGHAFSFPCTGILHRARGVQSALVFISARDAHTYLRCRRWTGAKP